MEEGLGKEDLSLSVAAVPVTTCHISLIRNVTKPHQWKYGKLYALNIHAFANARGVEEGLGSVILITDAFQLFLIHDCPNRSVLI